MLEALTAAVRRSLHEVARALNGDRKGSEVPPVFVLSVVLDSNRWVGRAALSLQRVGASLHKTASQAYRASACLLHRICWWQHACWDASRQALIIEGRVQGKQHEAES